MSFIWQVILPRIKTVLFSITIFTVLIVVVFSFYVFIQPKQMTPVQLFLFQNLIPNEVSLEYLQNNETKITNNNSLPPCPKNPPKLVGRILVKNSPIPTIEDLEQRFAWLQSGGHWSPPHCQPVQKLAIIIPYRNRMWQLKIFLQHMHPLLKKQQLDYTVFVVEQYGNGIFNKGSLMNTGFIEAIKEKPFDCFVFHDIDLFSEDDRNIYNCTNQPQHMSVAVNTMQYKLPYYNLFGGVVSIPTKVFKIINGYSNCFLGWGGEDDDMGNRLMYHDLRISRNPEDIARYFHASHQKRVPLNYRHYIVYIGKYKHMHDGLNNLKYELVERKNLQLYTWILVKVTDYK